MEARSDASGPDVREAGPRGLDVPVFQVGEGATPITPETVRKALDEE